MVGVPRSSGCGLCVRRRVKCDEVRPGCGNCIKYGAECPGYDRGLKFVAGKHAVRPRRKKGAAADEEESGGGIGPGSGSGSASAGSLASGGHQWVVTVGRSAPGISSGPSSSRASLEGFIGSFAAAIEDGQNQFQIHQGYEESSEEERQQQLQTRATSSPQGAEILREYVSRHVEEYLYELRAASAPFTLQPSPNRPQFIATLIQYIKLDQGADEMAIFDTWFTSLPPNLGNRVTLDSATCAMVMHLAGKAKGDEQLVGSSRELYGQSLRALQRALNHPSEWKRTETLAAAMLLCCFELFSGTHDASSWMAHAQGIARLMQQRGPSAHKDGLDAALLLSFRGIIIMNDMFSLNDKGCFLAEPKWKRVLRDNGRMIYPGDRTVPPTYINAMDDYFDGLSEIPQILKWGYMLREAHRHAMPVPADKIAGLEAHCLRIRQGFLDSLGRLAELDLTPHEVPSQDEMSIYDTVYEWEEKWAGAFYLGYWASMLILQETINQCRQDRSFEESNKGIAFEFADVKTQTWVKLWLDRFEKTYAATTKNTYPPTQANEYGYS